MLGIGRKRRWYARILLAVFVPMLLFSLVHLHEREEMEGSSCVECQHHVHHSHLASVDYCFDSCVLCQFLSLPFIAAILLAMNLLSRCSTTTLSQVLALLANGYAGKRSCRAPPCL